MTSCVYNDLIPRHADATLAACQLLLLLLLPNAAVAAKRCCCRRRQTLLLLLLPLLRSCLTLYVKRAKKSRSSTVASSW
jgi:uncharacterized membrane protein YhaH (DUF805 family)